MAAVHPAGPPQFHPERPISLGYDAFDAALPPTASTKRSQNLDESRKLAHKANPTSRLSRFSSAFDSVERGVSRLFGGMVATVGTTIAVLMQATWVVGVTAAFLAGRIAGGVTGLAVGCLVGRPLEGMKKGADIGATVTGCLVGAVISIGLAIPYILSYGIMLSGIVLLERGHADKKTKAFFYNLSTVVPQEIANKMSSYA